MLTPFEATAHSGSEQRSGPVGYRKEIPRDQGPVDHIESSRRDESTISSRSNLFLAPHTHTPPPEHPFLTRLITQGLPLPVDKGRSTDYIHSALHKHTPPTNVNMPSTPVDWSSIATPKVQWPQTSEDEVPEPYLETGIEGVTLTPHRSDNADIRTMIIMSNTPSLARWSFRRMYP